MKFIVEGLDCASCAAKIETKLNNDERVINAELNFITKLIVITFKKNIKEEEFLSIVDIIVKKYEPHTKVFPMLEYEAYEHQIMEKKDIVLIALGLGLFFGSFFINELMFPMLIAAYLLIGWNVIYSAILNIIKGEVFDENFLMMIATIAAFYIGEYHEAVAVFIFFKIGELFESYAIRKSLKSIDSAKGQTIKYVSYENPFDGKLILKSIDDINIGDIVHVKPGERVSYDGVVLDESSSFDSSALTGESLPIFRNEGETVLSGYININKPLRMKVEKTYSDSTYAKIVELVNNASNNHSDTEKMITKFARIYTPIVVLLAFMIVVIPTAFYGGNLYTWMYTGAIFLVVSCPCALVISIPLVYYIAIGVAAKKGIIIKGSKYLDTIRKIKNFVFDKTGTLTEGKFEIIEINGDQDTLKWAAKGEYFSTHPIAKAIVKEYSGEIEESKISNLVEYPSKGIKYKFNKRNIILGNKIMMNENNINVPEKTLTNSIVYVAKDNKFIGEIILQDTLKSSVDKTLKVLKNKTIHLLSGDQMGAVENVAKRLGINKYRAELFPEDKLDYIDALNDACFIGDGINDGPVLARANLGIAMGNSGSDLAIEQAQIIILDDDIGKIDDLILLSHRVKWLVFQNIILALSIKVGVMILATFGYSSMGMAIFADVGVALLAIINSMRLNYQHSFN